MIPLSAINQFLFCPRRAALIHVEGIFKDNQHTLRGDLVHEHADLAGYDVVKGVTLLRALPVWSERLGLNGKCDIVEAVFDTAAAKSLAGSINGSRPPVDLAQLPPPRSLLPVEFKLGKRRKWENDDAQLCAQALCLEEMFGVSIPRGAVFHADSKRRREVEFTPELRATTKHALSELHALLDSGTVPPAIFKPACEECSLFPICLPKATARESRATKLTVALFKTD